MLWTRNIGYVTAKIKKGVTSFHSAEELSIASNIHEKMGSVCKIYSIATKRAMFSQYVFISMPQLSTRLCTFMCKVQ